MAVLHVDDDPLNLRVVQEILSAFGLKSTQASNGTEALEQLGTHLFDVVLMDIHMPGISGVEVVRRLRASVGPERNTPVIALTADGLKRGEKYLTMGFDDLVAKPILVSRLYTAITRATAAPRGAFSRTG
ncbi:MAG: response regulator [Phenylobacterium sp.]